MSEQSDEEIRSVLQQVVAQLMGLSKPESTTKKEHGPVGQAPAAAFAAVAPAEVAPKIVVTGADHGGYELKIKLFGGWA